MTYYFYISGPGTRFSSLTMSLIPVPRPRSYVMLYFLFYSFLPLAGWSKPGKRWIKLLNWLKKHLTIKQFPCRINSYWLKFKILYNIILLFCVSVRYANEEVEFVFFSGESKFVRWLFPLENISAVVRQSSMRFDLLIIKIRQNVLPLIEFTEKKIRVEFHFLLFAFPWKIATTVDLRTVLLI